MYITINNVIGEKGIDLSYSIRSGKEVAVITMLSDKVQYKLIKPHAIIDSVSPGNKKLILSKMYAGRELISILERMVSFTRFVSDPRVIKTNKLKGITEMILNLDELDNTDNLEDRKPSNTLLTYHVTADEEFTCFDPHTPQYKKLLSLIFFLFSFLQHTYKHDSLHFTKPSSFPPLHKPFPPLHQTEMKTNFNTEQYRAIFIMKGIHISVILCYQSLCLDSQYQANRVQRFMSFK